MNLIAVMLGRKQYAAARVATKLENPVTWIGAPPLLRGITKMLSAGSCVPIIGSDGKLIPQPSPDCLIVEHTQLARDLIAAAQGRGRL